MQTLTPIKMGWKWLATTLNILVGSVNERTLIQGDHMLFRETPGGVLISVDLPAVQSLIDTAIAIKTNPPGGIGTVTTHLPTGTPGTGPVTDPNAPGGPDLSGSGGGGGWDANMAIPYGADSFVYPDQFDISNDISAIVITSACGSYLGGIAQAVSITSTGIVSGSLLTGCSDPAGIWFYTTYEYAGGGNTAGPQSPHFNPPPGGGKIILGGHPFLIPN